MPIVQACAETGSLALVGAPVQDETGQAHIGMLAVQGTGATVAYHKMWLGGAEPKRFTPGSKPAVLEVDGWRLGLAICKDTGIAQHATDTAAWPPTTRSGWRWPASPDQPGAATPRLLAGRASGRLMASCSSR
jgi:predicted amidohydrolase